MLHMRPSKTVRIILIVSALCFIGLSAALMMMIPHGERQNPPSDTSSASDSVFDSDFDSLPQHPDPPIFNPQCIEETDPSSDLYNFKYDIMENGKIVSEYRRPNAIGFGLPEEYTALEGVTTFRGNNFRNNSSWGTVDPSEERLSKIWSVSIGGIGIWQGVGWNGHPAIVRWDNETRQIMNMYPEKKDKDGLAEVIYAALDGKIRFLDLDDGTPTRPSINIKSPIKGSVTIDPRGYPLMYAGQGSSLGPGGGNPGFRVFSLIDGKMLLHIPGNDKFAYRYWPYFDSNALVDGASDTLFIAGENGVLYTVSLGTDYNPDAGTISIDPYIVKYRYKTPLCPQVGTEGSITAYSGYLMYAENSGLVQCVDLNTMTPVWIRHCTDDTDSTPLLDFEEDGSLSIYTACEVDKQGWGGSSYIRKLDAATGALLWEYSYPCKYHSSNGGVLASPVLGRGDIEGGVIFLIAKICGEEGDGVLVNLDKKTGEIIWEKYFPNFAWSSPAAVYTEDGKSYLVTCDSIGIVRLIEGKTGNVLDQTAIGTMNIEGSPAAFGNKVVVGTRGKRIVCLEIS